MKTLKTHFRMNGLPYTLLKRNEVVELYGIGGTYTDKILHCKKCSDLLWAEDAKEVDQINDHYSENEKYKNLDTISFPDFLQYYNALKIIDDKKYIRIKMLYSFNDLFRNNKVNQITPEIQKIHEENLYELIELFDKNDINELIMKAEA
jgi:hypothetical protein